MIIPLRGKAFEIQGGCPLDISVGCCSDNMFHHMCTDVILLLYPKAWAISPDSLFAKSHSFTGACPKSWKWTFRIETMYLEGCGSDHFLSDNVWQFF